MAFQGKDIISNQRMDHRLIVLRKVKALLLSGKKAAARKLYSSEFTGTALYAGLLESLSNSTSSNDHQTSERASSPGKNPKGSTGRRTKRRPTS